MRKRQLCIICLPVLIWLIIMGFYSGGVSERVYPPVEDGNTILVQGTIYKMESNDSEQTICLKDISIISEESSQLENLPNKIKMNIWICGIAFP